MLLLAGGQQALDPVSPAILPPHPRRVGSAGDETQDGGAEVDPARRDVARRLVGEEDVAGDESRRVGDGDQHGARECAGVEVGDVGDDPGVVDGRHGVCLQEKRGQQMRRSRRQIVATTHSDGGHEDGKVCQADIIQVDRDEQGVADDADDQRDDHVHSTFQKVVRRQGRRHQKDGCDQRRGHRILYEQSVDSKYKPLEVHKGKNIPGWS